MSWKDHAMEIDEPDEPEELGDNKARQLAVMIETAMKEIVELRVSSMIETNVSAQQICYIVFMNIHRDSFSEANVSPNSAWVWQGSVRIHYDQRLNSIIVKGSGTIALIRNMIYDGTKFFMNLNERLILSDNVDSHFPAIVDAAVKTVKEIIEKIGTMAFLQSVVDATS